MSRGLVHKLNASSTTITQQGFTIVEVMIVLAVSSALLVSGLGLVSGQQRKTEFSQAMGDIETQLKTVINNVETGYYAAGDFKCSSSGGVPSISAGSDTRGTKKDCIYLGRVVQFKLNTSTYNIYNVVGLRQKTNGAGKQVNVDNLSDAKPIAMATPSSNVDTTERLTLKSGLEVVAMHYMNGGPKTIGSVGFFSVVNNSSSTGNTLSQTVELRPVQNTTLGMIDDDTVTAIKAANLDIIPSGGVAICFKSGGTNQSGLITIGGNSRQLNISLEIKESTNCS